VKNQKHHPDDCTKNEQIVKGIVIPKMKILSSFTHPQVVPNLYELLFSVEHKKSTKQLMGFIDFHSIFFFSIL